MNFSGRDIAKLGWHALAALLMIAVAALVVTWTATEERKATAGRDATLSAKSQVEQRLGQVRTEEQEIKARTQQYQRLEERGIFGPERRLEWTELLRDLQAQLMIPGMNYELGAQAPLDRTPGSGPAFHVSAMKLKLELLHEEDLLNFLNRLRQQASALTLVRNCRLARAAAAPPAASGALLTAECEIDWITLRQPSAEGKP